MDGLPLYIQVRNSLREGIEKGTIRPDASGVLPSQQEFAEHFRVGLATVKRAIKDLEDMGLVMSRRGKGLTLSPALRRDVDEATGTKRMPSVGIALFDITGRMSSPYFRRIMSGVEAFSNERHIALHVVSLPGVEMDLQEETFLNSISLVNLDGLLILSPVSSGFVSRLTKREIPYVAVNVLADRGEVCHVIDFVATTAVVLDSVFGRGCKHPIIFIGNETKLSSCLKFFGYKQALIRHGIELDPSHVAYEDYDIDNAIRAVERRLSSGVELDAVVAYDDMMAESIQDYLASKGRTDVLVVGSGNYEGYEEKIKITTDEQLHELGYNSLATLFDMMNGLKPEKTKFTYDPILIERDKM